MPSGTYELRANAFQRPGGNDTPVGIETLQTSDTTETSLQNQPIYDLTGRKVKGILAPGIYLIGGKKVLMK